MSEKPCGADEYRTGMVDKTPKFTFMMNKILHGVEHWNVVDRCINNER
jgi:hypothetical protein